MRHAARCLVFAAAAVLSGCVHVTTHSPDPYASRASPAEAATIALRMNELSSAIISADKARLEALAWPELSYGHSGGRIEDRQQYVDALVSRKSIISKIDLSRTTTTMVGSDLALVRGHMDLIVESTGKPVPTPLEFLMVWQKRGGEWRLLARLAYKI